MSRCHPWSGKQGVELILMKSPETGRLSNSDFGRWQRDMPLTTGRRSGGNASANRLPPNKGLHPTAQEVDIPAVPADKLSAGRRVKPKPLGPYQPWQPPLAAQDRAAGPKEHP